MEKVRILWRRGGEGLGGSVTRGDFTAADGGPEIAVNAWSAWAPLGEVAGPAAAWQFPTIVVEGPLDRRGTKESPATPVAATAVELEFADNGQVFKSFTEEAPKGATIGFTYPGAQLDARGAGNPEFVASLRGLSEHARARRELLERITPEGAPMPSRFAIIGHLGGYGERTTTGRKGGGAGYGVRHCNPAILTDECRSLRMLGVNGFVGAPRPFEVAGYGEQFRRMYWGGPGSGDPLGFLRRGGKSIEESDTCPFDPAIKPHVEGAVTAAIEEHRAVAARESWALWTDEIGVFAKAHIARCTRCAEQFREYLRSQKVTLAEVGASSWEDVKPFDLWTGAVDAAAKTTGAETRVAPTDPREATRYYYTSRFMTYATAQVFPEAARTFKQAGIPLYAMQGPTPSWSGASLDWNEFYDLGANTAFVFETSNRDPRAWQWESYLADIGRGIAARHGMPMGCLVKPHRGAPAQRMLSVVSRGVRALEWYTYGPDYAKGDSFSQSPELLERVARVAQFLGRAEEFLYDAKYAAEPQVAFVSPRSSEIWGKASAELGVTAFEDAKWVYLALSHAHVPVTVLSEQQLAEGKLGSFKLLYIIGPNLRRDAAVQVETWVREGGTLWTDALGLSRDEANQPAVALHEMLGLGERKLERWGSVEPYRATTFKSLSEAEVPASAAAEFGGAKLRAAIGRESLTMKDGETLARFADGQGALVRRRHGEGEVMVTGLWAGLTYSAKVRRADFDMRADFDPTIRELIAAPAAALRLQPLDVSDPLVEAVLLQNGGRRAVALMNWAYSAAVGRDTPLAAENLRITFGSDGRVRKVTSLIHGDLAVSANGIVLPRLTDIDLLLLE